MKILYRAAAALTALLIVFVGATPARADQPSIYGCPNLSNTKGSICLYQWELYNGSGGQWNRALTDLGASTDGGVAGCTNLNDQYWNGTSNLVYDTTSSIVANTLAPRSYGLRFYEYINCNEVGRSIDCWIATATNGPVVWGLRQLIAIGQNPSLTCWTLDSNTNFQNTIASIKLFNYS